MLQGFALVLSFLAYHSFDGFWGMTHALGEGPVELSTFTWVLSFGWYFVTGVLPHIILGALQINYLVKFVKQSDKPVGNIVFRVIAWLLVLGVLIGVLGFGFLVGVTYI